jgi:hypothetical protein
MPEASYLRRRGLLAFSLGDRKPKQHGSGSGKAPMADGGQMVTHMSQEESHLKQEARELGGARVRFL